MLGSLGGRAMGFQGAVKSELHFCVIRRAGGHESFFHTAILAYIHMYMHSRTGTVHILTHKYTRTPSQCSYYTCAPLQCPYLHIHIPAHRYSVHPCIYMAHHPRLHKHVRQLLCHSPPLPLHTHTTTHILTTIHCGGRQGMRLAICACALFAASVVSVGGRRLGKY